MKQSVSAVFVVAVVFMSLVTPLAAQGSAYLIRVPFAFSIGSQVLPTGEYSVQEVHQGVVLIRGVDNPVAAYVEGSFVSNSQNRILLSKLVFNRYGRRYFLSQIWFEGSSRGDQMRVSREELQEAKLSPKVNTELLASGK